MKHQATKNLALALTSLVIAVVYVPETTAASSHRSPLHLHRGVATRKVSEHRQIALFHKGKQGEGEEKPATEHKDSGKVPPPEAPVNTEAVNPVPLPRISEPVTIHASEDSSTVDSALISVLRDLSKALKESEDAKKLEVGQQQALNSAISVLDLALDRAATAANRILPNDQKDRFEKNLVPESWESGSIKVSNRCHASLNVLWAKKINGSINVSIAGNYISSAAGTAGRLMDYVVIINGKSALDSGFDIQSQANVNYWIGKLTGISVDAGDGQAALSMPVLKAVLTQDWLTRSAVGKDLNAYAQELANEQPAPQLDIHGQELPAEAAPGDIVATTNTTETQEPTSNLDAAAVVETPKPTSEPATKTNAPSNTCRIVAPDRVVAGHPVTISVLNNQQKPEAFVALKFNGSVITTSAEGKALYTVPDDAVPGPTLHVSMKNGSAAAPITITVLQPLTKPKKTDAPKIDRIAPVVIGHTMVIDGHNFDGIAGRNKVMIDSNHPATVVVASPVQLKVILPPEALSGPHTVTISTNGLRSNVSQGQLAAVPPKLLSKAKPAVHNQQRRRHR